MPRSFRQEGNGDRHKHVLFSIVIASHGTKKPTVWKRAGENWLLCQMSHHARESSLLNTSCRHHCHGGKRSSWKELIRPDFAPKKARSKLRLFLPSFFPNFNRIWVQIEPDNCGRKKEIWSKKQIICQNRPKIDQRTVNALRCRVQCYLCDISHIWYIWYSVVRYSNSHYKKQLRDSRRSVLL